MTLLYIAIRAYPQNTLTEATLPADAANGLQRWRIAYIAGTNGIYSVTLPCGHAACNQYLSCAADCGNTGSDLYYQDDGSGRQQWQASIQPFLCMGVVEIRSVATRSRTCTHSSRRQQQQVRPVWDYVQLHRYPGCRLEAPAVAGEPCLPDYIAVFMRRAQRRLSWLHVISWQPMLGTYAKRHHFGSAAGAIGNYRLVKNPPSKVQRGSCAAGACLKIIDQTTHGMCRMPTTTNSAAPFLHELAMHV